MMKSPSPQKQLDAFIDKYVPEVAASARAVLKKMRAFLPGAIQHVYDNYNALVIGFGPNERPSDAVFSVVLSPRWVSLFFIWGVGLPDPHRLLRGSGNQVRSIRLETPGDLDKPEIRALMRVAVARSRAPFASGKRGKLIVQSISAKQRPRRPK